MPGTAPFDEHAADYDDWFERNPSAYQSELAALKALLPEFNRAVEVGVGTGRFAAALGISIGVEPSTAMARIASARGVGVLAGVAERLPLADANFEVVLMVTVICFVDNLADILREANRVLVSGGHLVIGFIDRDTEHGSQYEHGKSASRFYRHAKFYSSDELKASLESAGFGDLVGVQTIFEPPEKLRTVSSIEPGWGRGLFAVVRAKKVAGCGREPD